MNRQVLLMIVFALILLPITYWQAKTAQDQRLKQVADWRQKRVEYWDWVKKNPDKIHLYPDLVKRLQHPFYKPWLHDNPEVEKAVAAIGSGIVAEVSTASSTAPPASATPVAPTAAVPPRRKEFLQAVADQKSEEWRLTTKTMTVQLDAMGGSVDALTFNDIKSSSFIPVAKGDTPMKDLGSLQLLQVWDPRLRSFVMRSNATTEDLATAQWLHEEVKGGHRMSLVLPDGDLRVTKEYLVPDPIPGNEYPDYHIVLRISVENLGEKERTFNYSLSGPAGLVDQQTSRALPGEAVIGVKDEHGGYDTQRRAYTDVWKDVQNGSGSLKVQAAKPTQITFFGDVIKHFGCVIIPQDERLPIETASADTLLHALGQKPTEKDEAALKAPAPNIAKEVIVTGTRSAFAVSPGKTVTQDYVIFAGPLWKEALETHPVYAKADLGSLVNFQSMIPGVRALAVLLTKLLVGFHWVTRSWGVAIILLTILVRACLHPLMVWQTKNTQKMQALTPETNKLKEQFQDKDGKMSPENQKKFQAAQMELWQKHGLGPAQFAGCLGPLFLQLPIFYGLWNALLYSFELRHAGFLWIRDLTEPDVVARLPFNLPMHGTNALCILPIIMLLVYVLQMKTMPKTMPTGDSSQQDQQKIMQWMMPLFGYMFYSMQSGLLLYYITSSSLGMVEQRWIKKRLGILPPGTPPAPGTIAAKV